MKRLLLILSVTISILSLIFFASPLLLKITGLDVPIKNYLLPKAIDTTQADINLDNFSVGLGTLEFTDISVVTPKNNIKFLITSVNFDFDFYQLIFHPDSPKKALQKITLKNPRLIIEKSSAPENEKDQGNKFSNQQLSDVLNKISALSQIQIKQGKVIYKNGLGQYISLAQNINGRLQTIDNENYTVKADGSFFSTDDNNFNLETGFNIDRETISGKISLIDYQLNNTMLPYFSQSLILDSGVLEGNADFFYAYSDSAENKLNGRISASGAGGSINERIFSETDFDLEIENSKITLVNGNGLLEGNPVIFSAEMNDIEKSALYADFEFTDFPAAQFSLNPGIKNIFEKGKFPLIGHLSADFIKDEYELDIFSPALELDSSNTVSNLNSKLKFVDDVLYLKHLTFNSYGIDFSGSGLFDMGRNRLGLKVIGTGQTEQRALFDNMSGKRQSFDISLSIDTDLLKINGEWNYTISHPADTLLACSGTVTGRDELLAVNLTSSNFKILDTELLIKDLFRKPDIVSARVDNFPFHSLTSNQILLKIFNDYTTNIKLNGSFDLLKGNLSFIDKQSGQTRFLMKTNIEPLFSSNRSIKGSIELKKVFGFYDFKTTPSQLDGSINFPAGLTGELHLDMSRDGLLDGKFQLDEFDAGAVLSDSLFSSDLRIDGFLDGKIELKNTINNPEIAASLTGSKFVLNDVGYYRADVTLNAGTDRFSIDSVNVSLNNLTLMEGNMFVSLPDGRIEGKAGGQQIDTDRIIATILPDKPFLKGTGYYTVNIGGLLKQPEITAEVMIDDGQLDKLDFERLSLKIKDSIRPDGTVLDLNDHKLSVELLDIFQPGRMHLQADGSISFAKEDSIDINVNFDGDALSLIPIWVPFFLDGTSNSKIFLNIAGTPGRLRINNGFCRIERGELWLKSVAPHITRIDGLIDLKSGTKQVDFVDFTAEINDRSLVLNSVRNVSTQGRGVLKPWYFRGLDLDFGVIKMETSDGGIELNIPGLMEKEDFGYLSLEGKAPGESFYFAGPVKHPSAYGKVALYNTRMTYPFLKGRKPRKKPSRAVEFLKNMDWDVMLESAEDVLYHRQIPAFIDNVNTEVFVDETSPGFAFSGIINEGSFKVLGKLTSSRGTLEYLDQNFRVDHFSVEFSKGSKLPVISGNAWTTIRDSVGAVPKTIYLKLYGLEEGTGVETQQVEWENLRFKLESADPQLNETQDQVLAYMGFSVANIKNKATSVGGAITEKYLIKPLLRPIERALQRGLGVDLVRINSNIARNLFYRSFGAVPGDNLFFNPYQANGPYLNLMQSSEFTIGKYLSQDLYFTYTGQLVSVYNNDESEFNLNHSLGLEYRFLRNVLLEFEYDRESLGYFRLPAQKHYMEDFKIRLRHSFTF